MTRPNPQADPGVPCLCGFDVPEGCPEHDATDSGTPAEWSPPGDVDDAGEPWPVEWGGAGRDCGFTPDEDAP